MRALCGRAGERTLLFTQELFVSIGNYYLHRKLERGRGVERERKREREREKERKREREREREREGDAHTHERIHTHTHAYTDTHVNFWGGVQARQPRWI